MSAHDSEKASPRILIIKLSSIGDLTHALPAVHAIKTGLNATIDWVTQPEYAEFVGCFTDVDKVIVFPRRKFFAGMPAYLRTVRSQQYDMVIDLQGLLKSALAGACARSGRRLGPSFQREGARFLYHEVCGKRNLARHAVEQCMDVVSCLGITPPSPEFCADFPAVALEGPRPWIGIAPFSRWPSKNWPIEHFGMLIRELQVAVGGTCFLVGGADDREACEHLCREYGSGGLENLAGRFRLAETGGALAAMDILVSNDSGPAHIACAAGTRTVVLFGPTDETRTGPYGENHRVVRAPSPCVPCYSRTCRRHGAPCLSKIPVQRVAETVRELLQK